MGIWEMSAGELILAGGPIMVPIIICSIYGFAIVIMKLISFSAIKTNVYQLKQDVFGLIKQNKIKEAIQLCENNRSPVAKILKAGILKFGERRETIKEAMEDASLFQVPQLEKKLPALATITQISPLLGLLGTVTGMTGSFHTIQMRANSMNPVTPGDLAGGIWEALLTTVAGLVVAIPTSVAYNYFVNRVDTMVLEMEHAATELVDLLSHLTESRTLETEIRNEI